MKFICQPGIYYVGDPVFILSSDDLRSLFKEEQNFIKPEGMLKDFIASRQLLLQGEYFEQYWICKLPHHSGTVFDQNNNPFSFEWGFFGCVPWEWIEYKSAHESQRLEFTEPFNCSCTEDTVTIGHLHFTLNPK